MSDIANPDDIISEVKTRAKLFVNDNFESPTSIDYIMIESAMMVGLSIGLEVGVLQLGQLTSHS